MLGNGDKGGASTCKRGQILDRSWTRRSLRAVTSQKERLTHFQVFFRRLYPTTDKQQIECPSNNRTDLFSRCVTQTHPRRFSKWVLHQYKAPETKAANWTAPALVLLKGFQSKSSYHFLQLFNFCNYTRWITEQNYWHIFNWLEKWLCVWLLERATLQNTLLTTWSWFVISYFSANDFTLPT